MAVEWFLVRTKAGEERRANEHLARFACEAFLPLMKARVRRWNKPVEVIMPLFASYLFALFDVECDYNRVRHTRGVQYVVRNGEKPAVVPKWIMSDLKTRCADGPIEILKREFLPGEPVRVVGGPLREFEGIFERNLSGSDRVAILFLMMGVGARVVLPANMVESAI